MTIRMTKKASLFPLYFLFFALCLALYFNGLGSSFILDDRFLISDNLHVRNFSIPGIFSSDIFSFYRPHPGSPGGYYRPLQALSYAFEHLFWKLNPLGYRLDNIILHSFNGFLVSLIVRRIFGSLLLGVLSGIFFAVHPAQACLVTFIAGRSNLLETFFVLLSVLGFLRCLDDGENKIYYGLSLLSYIAALLSREGALLAPVYILICASFIKNGKKKSILLLLPYLAVAGLYLSLRNIFLPCDKFNVLADFSLRKIIEFIVATQEYFWQLVFPLRVKIGLFGAFPALKPALYACSFALFAYFLIRSVFLKDRASGFGLLWYFAGLLPLFNLGSLKEYLGPVLSEHYVYNAMVGFSFLTAYFFFASASVYPRIGRAALAAACLYFSLLTIAANTHYKDEVSFYQYVLGMDRRNVIAHVNLGNAYNDKKMYAQAAEQARLALEKEPLSWDARLLMGNIYQAQGQLAQAIKSYNDALAINPGSYEACNNLGLAYQKQGNALEAMRYFKRSAELNPMGTGVLHNLADSLMRNGSYRDAAGLIKDKILRLDPRDAAAYEKLGIALAESGDHKGAANAFLLAIKIAPRSSGAVNNLAVLYANAGDIGRAVSLWEYALNMDPRNKEIKRNIDAAKKIKPQGHENK